MQAIMAALGYDCPRISTNSTLALREAAAIRREPLKILTRANNHRRKNLPLFRELQATYRDRVANFDAHLGLKVLPEADYARLIDGYNCYLCTSWQEGGPLPLMDAMRRGCAVLTTPVGQTDELVQEGVNGFICRTRAEFAARIELLAADPGLLHDMRLNSLRISSQRASEAVRAQLVAFLSG
jgi:glycosyltransferase involved in cell wall biosynthesis